MGNVEMWFERETDHMLWKGGSCDHEERQKRRVHSGIHKENTFSKALAGKIRQVDFLEFFCNHLGLKTRVLKVCGLSWGRSLRCCPTPGEKEGS